MATRRDSDYIVEPNDDRLDGDFVSPVESSVNSLFAPARQHTPPLDGLGVADRSRQPSASRAGTTGLAENGPAGLLQYVNNGNDGEFTIAHEPEYQDIALGAVSPADDLVRSNGSPASRTGRQSPVPTVSSIHEETPRSLDDPVDHSGTQYPMPAARGVAENSSLLRSEEEGPHETQSPPAIFLGMEDHVHDAKMPSPHTKGGGGPSRAKRWCLNRRIPVVAYILSTVQVAVFIAELVKAAQLTGLPIQIQPQFNPMIGPSQYVLINMGSRFDVCMRNVAGVQDSTTALSWPCPNSTTTSVDDASNQCTLSELCGFGGVPEPWVGGSLNQTPAPNQWWRFIVPMFLHAGVVHIGFNLLLQLTLGVDVERSVGSIPFFLVYVASGTFGFVMGGTFGASGTSSTGASGALFGIMALALLDLLYPREKQRSHRQIAWIVLAVVVSFIIGLLPGIDNFSHLGGFAMGLPLGLVFLGPHRSEPSYSRVGIGAVATSPLKKVAGAFKAKSGCWWATLLFRLALLGLAISAFAVLLNAFYNEDISCDWCKYLSCIVSVSRPFEFSIICYLLTFSVASGQLVRDHDLSAPELTAGYVVRNTIITVFGGFGAFTRWASLYLLTRNS